MIVYSAFKGDKNNELMNAQHHMYNFIVWKIFDKCKRTFLICDLVCNKLSAEERSILIEQNSYDHRTLQTSHDLIAIAFRYMKRDGAISMFEPNIVNILDYFNSNYTDWSRGNLSDMELILAYHWENYFNNNIEYITSVNTMLPKFVRHVINASSFNPNNNIGTESEHQLKHILTEYFQIKDILI